MGKDKKTPKRSNPSRAAAAGSSAADDEVQEVDPLWAQMERLPFFQAMTMPEKREYYEAERQKEVEREERREEIEREERREEAAREERQREREFQLEMEIRRQPPAPTEQAQPAGRPRSTKIQLPDWNDKTRPDQYFSTCERLFTSAHVEPEQWVGYLVPKLPQRALEAYNALPLEAVRDYELFKSRVLDIYAISSKIYRKNFFQWIKRNNETYAEFMARLREQLRLWVSNDSPEEGSPDYEELLLRYRLDQTLPEDLNMFVIDKEGKTVQECVALADRFVVSHQVLTKTRDGKVEASAPNKANPSSATSKTHEEKSSVPSKAAKNGRFCNFCKKKGHTQEQCFSDPNSSAYKGPRKPLQPNAPSFVPKQDPDKHALLAHEVKKTSEDGPGVHPLLRSYTGDAVVKGNTRKIRYLRDTGSTLSFLAKDALPGEWDYRFTGQKVKVTGINRVSGTYPLCEVNIECDLHIGPLTAAIVDQPPLPGVDLLLGNDLDAMSEQLEIPCGVITRAQRRAAMSDPLLTSDLAPLFNEEPNPAVSSGSPPPADASTASDTAAEESADRPLPVPDLPLAELSPAKFKAMQQSDPTLLPLWEMAGREKEGSGYYVDDSQGLLMYLEQPTKVTADWRIKRQIVAPKELRFSLMKWAHDEAAAGHVGEKKTLARMKEFFTWPGIRRDVQLHCRGCGPCQRLGGGARPSVVPLKSLPIAGRPFEFISADFIGPMPTTRSGNRYALTIIDHCTKYLEAIPLPVADASAAKRCFTEVFARHGMPRQLLTDRGSTFTSEAFQDFTKELGVQMLLTASYRPQSNGTIERANGTLKRMLKACLEEDSDREWDELLPWVLYAYRTSVHSSTGFSPFFLLFGREPTSPLGLLSLTWLGDLAVQEVPADEYAAALQSRLSIVWSEAAKNEGDQKAVHAEQYDRRHKAKTSKFNRGELVLIQLPTRGKPLTGEWQGPYPVEAQVRQQTYIVNTPDKRIKRRHLHVNALRPWKSQPNDPFTCFASCTLPEGQQVGDVMDRPGPPTELEVALDPTNYDLNECLATGLYPDIGHLPADQQAETVALCDAFPALFDGQLGRMQGVMHDIDVGDHAPVQQHYYRCSPDKVALMRQEVEAMLDLGVITPSRSQWSSSLLLVRKASGEWRPCVDYRQVNAITKGESFPLPRLDDLIDQVGNAPFITTLDLSKGYWQIEMTPRAREISAFTTPFGHYEFVTMPFGLKLAPMTFQRAMNEVLTGLSDFAVAYLDDISIRSSNWEDHLRHVAIVFQRLTSWGLTLNARKCVLAGGSVRYLGYQVGSGLVAPVQAKVEAVEQIPLPSTKKEVRSFLGVVGFYRRFIPYFADAARPLTDLLRGSKRGDLSCSWTPECTTAFQRLKGALTCGPVLKAPDFSKPFEIYTDASEVGIAAVLTQCDEDAPKPVAYYSRKLLPRECNYSTIEKELLAIMAALDAFHVYVGFGPVVVHSDHRPLVWLRRCTTANQRVLRWALTLSEYDLRVEHIRGGDNCLADMLSRQFS